MWTWLLNLVTGGVIDKALSTITSIKASGAQVDVAAIQAATAQAQADAEVIKAEQGNWLTRSIRPLMALPFVAYVWKLVLWDKVLGLGSTDGLSPELWSLMMTVFGAYMGGRTAERVAQIWARR